MTTIEQILEDYKSYTCPAGLVSDIKNPTTTAGNALLFTAEKQLILESHITSSLEQYQVFEDSDITRPAIRKECQIEPGLFRRGKNWTDQEGPDDYIGVASIHGLFANDIIQYGETHYYKWGIFKFPFYYNNEGIINDVRAWLGRQPQLIAHFYFSFRLIEPSLFQRLWWALVIATSGISNPAAQDSWILSWILVKSYERKSRQYWYCNLACNIWRWNLKRKRGSMKEVFKSYFSDPNHPTTKWCQD